MASATFPDVLLSKQLGEIGINRCFVQMSNKANFDMAGGSYANYGAKALIVPKYNDWSTVL